MSIHLVMSEAEQNAICNALHFSLVMHNSIFNGGIDADALEQALEELRANKKED